MTYRDWLEQVLASANPWQEHVDRRRTEALRSRRTASGNSIASYPTLSDLQTALAEWRRMPRDGRPYAWGATRVNRYSLDPAPNEPADHLRRYDRALSSDERSWLGATCAPELHRLYSAATGYTPKLASVLAHFPAPSGGQASLAAAKITGASWGSEAARRQAFRRATPRYREKFSVIL